MWIGHRKEIRISLRWPILIINPVNKTKLSCLWLLLFRFYHTKCSLTSGLSSWNELFWVLEIASETQRFPDLKINRKNTKTNDCTVWRSTWLQIIPSYTIIIITKFTPFFLSRPPSRGFTKPWRQRQQERHCTKESMSSTMAAQVRTFLCHPLQDNSVKWPNFALSGERETRRIIFLKNVYFKFIVVFPI